MIVPRHHTHAPSSESPWEESLLYTVGEQRCTERPSIIGVVLSAVPVVFYRLFRLSFVGCSGCLLLAVPVV